MNYTTKMKKNAESIQLYYGQYFGYPSCCITSFVKIKRENRTEEQQIYIRNHFEHTGFIPCHLHAKAINKGEVQDWELIENRQHNFPFPYDKEQ